METLTENDKNLLLKLVRAAWPKFEEYLPYLTRGERGNLTSLKKKGLVRTFYVRDFAIKFSFTPEGRELVFKYQAGDTHSGNNPAANK